jgi:hypothetical protein
VISTVFNVSGRDRRGPRMVEPPPGEQLDEQGTEGRKTRAYDADASGHVSQQGLWMSRLAKGLLGFERAPDVRVY